MIKWFKEKLGLCNHEFQRIGSVNIGISRDGLTIKRYVYECKKCHKLKTKDIIF